VTVMWKIDIYKNFIVRTSVSDRFYRFTGSTSSWMLTLLPSLADTINRQRLSLFGHVAHMDLGTPAHDALDCAMARRMEQHPPSGWKRPPGRPCCTWTQQIGNSSTSSVHHEWTHAAARGHATRLALRVSATQAFWKKEGLLRHWSSEAGSVTVLGQTSQDTIKGMPDW